jgi:hypothetical protein
VSAAEQEKVCGLAPPEVEKKDVADRRAPACRG